MKTLPFILSSGIFCLQMFAQAGGAESQSLSTATPALTPTAELTKAQLVKKYDANGNGKIDVGERKGYQRELAETTRASIRADLKTMKVTGTDVPRSLRSNGVFRAHGPWGRKPDWVEYDLNHDGRLDANELRELRANPRPKTSNPDIPRPAAIKTTGKVSTDTNPTGGNDQ